MEPRLRGLLRFALRLINSRAGYARKSLLQAGPMQQPALAVDVLQVAIPERPRYS